MKSRVFHGTFVLLAWAGRRDVASIIDNTITVREICENQGERDK